MRGLARGTPPRTSPNRIGAVAKETLAPSFIPHADAEQRLYDLAIWAAQRGYSLEMHAYTDHAANHILDVLDRVALQRPIEDLRWTIAHISSTAPTGCDPK
jgi:hypothetical protein